MWFMLSYSSIDMTKYHYQGNLQMKHLIWHSEFQKVRVLDYHGRELGSKQAGMALE